MVAPRLEDRPVVLPFHITFDGASDVVDLADRYQQALTLPTLDLVPAEGLHLTMQGVGFADEGTPGDLNGIITAACTRCRQLDPFDLTLGPADADPEAVMLQTAPWQPVEELRATVRAAIADVWGPERVPETADGFTPHVSVAYSGADTSAEPLRQRLFAVEPMSVTTTVRAIQLIDLNRDERVYRWTTVVTMPLGG
ncbi:MULTISPECIES: 2'-5' RNA ligase family protein [unclassified Frankia]|uniref:2'-5' RNA ligase family protein n=1 Tax=unclassified Frankia TaxID=2632575 RepID=UPI00202487CF